MMPFTVSGQHFRTMFYVSMHLHFCVFIVVFFLLFFVYIVCSLSVSLPDLANKDVHKLGVVCPAADRLDYCNSLTARH